MAITKIKQEQEHKGNVVEVETSSIPTLIHLAKYEPEGIKAIMNRRFKEELNWTIYKLAKEYAKLKEGHSDVNPCRYTNTVAQVFKRPETARWHTVCLVLAAMGLLVQVVATNQQVYSLSSTTTTS